MGSKSSVASFPASRKIYTCRGLRQRSLQFSRFEFTSAQFDSLLDDLEGSRSPASFLINGLTLREKILTSYTLPYNTIQQLSGDLCCATNDRACYYSYK